MSRITLLHAPKVKLLRGTCTAGTDRGWASGSLGLVKSADGGAGSQCSRAKWALKKNLKHPINAVAMTGWHRGLTPASN